MKNSTKEKLKTISLFILFFISIFINFMLFFYLAISNAYACDMSYVLDKPIIHFSVMII